MSLLTRKGAKAAIILLAALAVLALVAGACGDDDDGGESSPTAAPTDAPTAAPTAEPTDADDDDHDASEIIFDAATATITIDGDTSDWADIEGVTVPMEQIDLDNLDPAQVEDLEIEIFPVDDIDVTLKVATDAENIYVLLEVPDDYDFNPEDHNLSASMAVMFRIDEPATVHMGVEEEDLETSLGLVDIWHWELDCPAGQMSGGGGIAGGDDPDCNLDDEYAPTPEDREDDGGGDVVVNATAENSLSGIWQHTAAGGGAGAEGVWIFEMSRPLQTGDTQDFQFESGGTAYIALAYFDPDESPEGWTDAGHLQSAESGWIEVTLP